MFLKALEQHFPEAVPAELFLTSMDNLVEAAGFRRKNTIMLLGLCRDEICRPLFDQIQNHWNSKAAGCFDMSSLGGLTSMGKTGVKAAMSHAPQVTTHPHYLFLAMPHIAIDENGEVGKVSRTGITKKSHACGALVGLLEEMKESGLGADAPPLDLLDLEESFIRHRLHPVIVRHMHSIAGHPDLVALTKIAAAAIKEDLEQLITITMDKNTTHHAVVVAIQIHGPNVSNFIAPVCAYASIDGHQTPLRWDWLY